MTSFVGIGITTYADISTPAYAAALYDAYEKSAPKLTPDHVKVWSMKQNVRSREDFARLWRAERPFRLTDEQTGQTLEKGAFIIGVEWSRRGGGRGQVEFQPEMQADRTAGITAWHPYSARTNWLGLFRNLVQLCKPSHAMLHLFTGDEMRGDPADRFGHFNSPISGEAHFVSWRSSLGDWRRPDSWDHAARRTYKHLPELSWANFLGNEFSDQFDQAAVAQNAAHAEQEGAGLLFTVSGSLSDVSDKHAEFNERRRLLRSAFREDFFRLP